MSKISDELRETAEQLYQGSIRRRFIALASRIDAEMVELPRGKDGRPIHVGDTVYGEDGKAWHVRGVTIGEKSPAYPNHVIRATDDAGEFRYLKTEWLSHERPDSWERIAQELDELFDDAAAERRIRVSDQDALHKFADRIRRLAEREDGR